MAGKRALGSNIKYRSRTAWARRDGLVVAFDVNERKRIRRRVAGERGGLPDAR